MKGFKFQINLQVAFLQEIDEGEPKYSAPI